MTATYVEPEITSDGETVWVNAPLCLARFGKNGIDVHTADTSGCLYCTHDATRPLDWETFKAKVWEHHGIAVTDEFKPERFR